RGWLDVKLVPERRNTVKVLLFLDVGGSMDPHVRVCEELFSAARAEFRHLDFYYFHNCPYEALWKNTRRRHDDRTPTWTVLRTFDSTYRAIFVGDAAMSPFELTHEGGSVEHWNEESGLTWLKRLASQFPKSAWINPAAEKHCSYSPTTGLIAETLGGRMFHMTLEGLDRAMRELSR
ncbi:MAG: VWA domain-containing protein, partial [Nitrospiraceae bacterium]